MKIGQLTETFANDELKITGAFNDGKPIACVVYLPRYYISLQGVNNPPRPVLGATYTGNGLPNNMVTAFRVQNITAEPKNNALGSYLVWRAALQAQTAGVHHLLAMKVNPKTNNWYARMGFREYDLAVTLQSLLQLETTIKGQMAQNPGEEFLEMLAPALENVMEQKADMVRFATINDVIRDAKGDWDTRWRPDGAGWESRAA